VAPELTSVVRCGPKLQRMWQHMDARSAPCLDLELICGVSDLQGTDNNVAWCGMKAHLLIDWLLCYSSHGIGASQIELLNKVVH
jgi:hypothetical protein